MRRKLAYSNPVLANSSETIDSLPQGDWHVSKTGGTLRVSDSIWAHYAYLGKTQNDADFYLGKISRMLVQALDGTTCRDIAIESKQMHALASGGGFRASSPRRPRRTELEAGDRR